MASSDLHRLVAHNIALQRQADEHTKLIHDAGERELERIQREIDSITPGATLLDADLATHYHDLVTQRAQLLRTLW